MIRRLAPRRLGTDEEATVVEHLTELRHRLLIVVFAIVPAFALTFTFHERIMEWLTGPLPDDKKLVTLGVVEPFTVSIKVSLIAFQAPSDESAPDRLPRPVPNPRWRIAATGSRMNSPR